MASTGVITLHPKRPTIGYKDAVNELIYYLVGW